VTERQRDVAEIVLGFARTLRHAGVPASPDRVQAMVAALGHLDVLDPSQVFWAGRLTLCADPADLERYDAAFAAYFGGQLPRTVRRTALQQVLIASLDPQSRDGVDGADDSEDGQPYAARASRQEVLRHRDVAELTPAEREEIARLFALLTPRVAPRMTRDTSRRLEGWSIWNAPCAACSRRAASRVSWPGAPGAQSHGGWCCSSMSAAPWRPTPTRCCASPTRPCALRRSTPRSSRSAPDSPG
jgi:uncharacterized protein with von Willebrand factor type A (vWA) domain